MEVFFFFFLLFENERKIETNKGLSTYYLDESWGFFFHLLSKPIMGILLVMFLKYLT
jgi:hypothetical protein